MQTEQRPRGLSPTVRLLGLVSMFADVSSEMVYPINPIFITGVLRAPAWTLGLIEGVAECTASVLKFYSGWLSDRLGKRKPFATLGYLLGAVGKPMVAVSAVWWQVLGARFVDRFGKGLRTAPRDALIAENCAADQRGRAFGFHRAMDTTGAVLGPLIGYLLLRHYAGVDNHTRLAHIYWFAFFPGLLGVALLALFVRERTLGTQASTAAKEPPRLASWAALSPQYRRYLAIVALFSLGNSSDTFLILRAQQRMGAGLEQLLLLYALFNVVEASLGYFAGGLSDRVGRRALIATGYLIFAVVYLGFALVQHAAAVWVLFIIYGLYYTCTQGPQRAFAADLSHPDRRAGEIGLFHMVVGIAALPASLGAGLLYDWQPAAPFILGAGCAALAALLMATVRRQPAG